jgi:hypothetical protein
VDGKPENLEWFEGDEEVNDDGIDGVCFIEIYFRRLEYFLFYSFIGGL